MTFRVTQHKWWTSDKSRLVESGDPDAAFLAFAKGDELAESTARRVGLLPPADRPPVGSPVPDPDTKIRDTTPATKLGRKPANKAADPEETL